MHLPISKRVLLMYLRSRQMCHQQQQQQQLVTKTKTGLYLSGNEAKTVTRPHNMTQKLITAMTFVSVSTHTQSICILALSKCVFVCSKLIKFTIMRTITKTRIKNQIKTK